MISVWSRLKVEKKCPPSNHNSNPQQLLSYPRATCQNTNSTAQPTHLCALSCPCPANSAWSADFPVTLMLTCRDFRHLFPISVWRWDVHTVDAGCFNPLAHSNPTLVLQLCHSQTCRSLLQPFFWLGCGTLRKIPRADRWHCRHRFPACSAVLAKSWEVAMNCTIICLPNCLSHAWLQNLISIQTVGENHKPWWVMVKFNVTLYRKYGHVPKSRAFHSN